MKGKVLMGLVGEVSVTGKKEVQIGGRDKEAAQRRWNSWGGQTSASTKEEASDIFLFIFSCLSASVNLETPFCKEAILES